MVLSLVGYRGVGKTTVAQGLAMRLGWPWLDADVELERRAGRTIREIFAADGEPTFRQLETELLAELLTRDQLVLATGGGAILNPATRARLRAAGTVVWLTAQPATIAARLAGDATTADRRPNLTTQGGLAEIEHVLQQREALYREVATLTLSTEDQSPAELIERILAALPRQATNPTANQ